MEYHKPQMGIQTLQMAKKVLADPEKPRIFSLAIVQTSQDLESLLNIKLTAFLTYCCSIELQINRIFLNLLCRTDESIYFYGMSTGQHSDRTPPSSPDLVLVHIRQLTRQ
jgi:hypothetical protein